MCGRLRGSLRRGSTHCSRTNLLHLCTSFPCRCTSFRQVVLQTCQRIDVCEVSDAARRSAGFNQRKGTRKWASSASRLISRWQRLTRARTSSAKGAAGRPSPFWGLQSGLRRSSCIGPLRAECRVMCGQLPVTCHAMRSLRSVPCERTLRSRNLALVRRESPRPRNQLVRRRAQRADPARHG